MSDSTARGNVRVSGAGTIATGTYQTVSVSGSATLAGDIDCIDLKVSGAADGDGSLRAERATVHGTFGYRGDANLGRLNVSGTASFGALAAKDLSVSGTVQLASLSATTVKVQGYLEASGDCEAERFVTQGAFKIGGLLNAGAVDITLGGKCVAGEIGGEAIGVRIYPMGALKKLVTTLVSGWETRLSADSIEGDDVRLEHTTARVVRGATVVIGQGCEIELVEYTGTYSAAPDAKVKSVRKVGESEPEGGDAEA